MTLKQWLKSATETLNEQSISSASLDSELILAHALDKPRTYLLAHPDDSLDEDAARTANKLLERRATHEPMAFILGEREFFGLPFTTDNRALIPRGETEPLVETALNWLKQHPDQQTVADIGTGAGTIIVSLAHTVPQHHYLATELSEDSLALAKHNAKKLGANVTFYQGDLGTPLLPEYTGKINVLTANLPYIASDLLVSLDPTVQYFEPNLALEGGHTGLELYEQFMPQAAQLLAANGLLLCEHEFDQSETMRDLAHKHFPTATIRTLKDNLGHDRILSCEQTS